MKALIFDCDGVLAETERDGHRVAFNMAFKQKNIPVEWDVNLYKDLLTIAGGKERMTFYFHNNGWPEQYSDREELIKELHRIKTELFMNLIKEGSISLRPGVARLIDEAINEDLMLAVCSTSNERSVNLIVDKLLGKERKKHFNAILAGDIVSKKKPDPEIYILCKDHLGIEPSQCVVIEDSRNGLLSAKNAGMHCLVTTNVYTKEEDFTEADMVVNELGDPPFVKISINDLKQITKK